MNPRRRKEFVPKSDASNKAAEIERLNKEKLLRLDKIVEDSSEKNRNYFAAYLGLLIYVQAIVFSTTDLNLLLATEELKMPIIDLTVPLVGFYVVIPFFIIALHFNFLQNLESHHNKLMRWQESHPDGQVPRFAIQPFIFDFAILENEGQMARLVRWANVLLCYNFAPITLALVLIRFSDRQDWLVTVFHYLTFVFDVWLVWKLRLALKDNQNPQSPPTVPSIRGFFSDFLHEGFHGGLGFLVFIVTIATISIGGTNADFFVIHVQPIVQPVAEVSQKLRVWKPDDGSFLNNNFFKEYIQPLGKPVVQSLSRPIELVLPRISIEPIETIWKPDDNLLETEAKFAESPDWVKYFKEHGKGFIPAAISLRLASLRQQNLIKAQMSEAQLQGANLVLTQLQGANLSSAQLQEADLVGAKLQGANLVDAQLQRANLSFAKLQGVDLTLAQLQGANLRSAQIQGADLNSAGLQGVNLSFAKLQGADLNTAKMQGANLRDTQLQGSNLSDAQLQGAILIATGTVGVQNPSYSNVFAITSHIAANNVGVQSSSYKNGFAVFKHKIMDVFDKSEIKLEDWVNLEAIAKEIPSDNMRANYLTNIKQAKNHPSFNAEKAWIFNSATVAVDTLIMICNTSDELDDVSRVAAVSAIYNNYKDSGDYNTTSEGFSLSPIEPTPEFKNLLKNIDKTLCTHESCKDIRDGIKGLDCKTVTK